jgi:hypothetical protein
VTWGYDFAYFDANNTFGLIDDIVTFMNKRGASLKFVFSTVDNYSKAVRSEYSSKGL